MDSPCHLFTYCVVSTTPVTDVSLFRPVLMIIGHLLSCAVSISPIRLQAPNLLSLVEILDKTQLTVRALAMDASSYSIPGFVTTATPC